MVRVGVAGATGYAGIELLRILRGHPVARVTAVTAESNQGKPLSEVFPHAVGLYRGPDADGAVDPLAGAADTGAADTGAADTGAADAGAELVAGPNDAGWLAERCDLVFMALPHGAAMKLAPPLLAAGKKVIDLGADFRLRSAAEYTRWYKVEHAAVEILAGAVYGLPEIYGERLAGASLVANPGCYPTSCILAAAPLLRAGLVEHHGIIFDSKSGVSGAGRGLSLGTHFGEVNENLRAYGIAGEHRHTPEIEQTLSDLAGEMMVVEFTPHLVPMTRGILTTAYFTLRHPATTAGVIDLFADYYRGRPFVRVRRNGLPQTKEVLGSNYCDLAARVDERTGRVVVISVLDNLMKGAAGQAVQNMNLILGLDERTGLDLAPVYP